MNRREFLTTAGVAGATTAVGAIGADQAGNRAHDQRAVWIETLRRLADPVLKNLANGTLKARMPVEQASGVARFTGSNRVFWNTTWGLRPRLYAVVRFAA